MSKYDVVIKSAEEIQVASVRDVVPTTPEQGPLWQELEGYLAMQRVKPTEFPAPHTGPGKRIPSPCVR